MDLEPYQVHDHTSEEEDVDEKAKDDLMYAGIANAEVLRIQHEESIERPLLAGASEDEDEDSWPLAKARPRRPNAWHQCLQHSASSAGASSIPTPKAIPKRHRCGDTHRPPLVKIPQSDTQAALVLAAEESSL